MTMGRDGAGDRTTARPRNLVASVKQRLLTSARESGDAMQAVLTRYALERLLYRLGQSPFAGEFVVKGALLFALWTDESHRATRDLDLLGFGTADVARLVDIFRALCQVAVEDDGLAFLEDSVHGATIREDQEYGGIRLQLMTLLGKARIPLQVDVGFGDAITPAPTVSTFPTLLPLSAPRLRTYPRETVVAEKFQAMVALGLANTRMKDFFDLWTLAHRFAFDGPTLAAALRATFERRTTPLPATPPLALTAEFGGHPMKQAQWAGFLRKVRSASADLRLSDVTPLLADLLLPPAHALIAGEPFELRWQPDGPWQPG